MHKGEVCALVGENGAGKTNLVKILTGVYQPDEGEIFLQGKKIVISCPHKAQNMGISIVYQDFNLIPNMSISKNILLGREPHNFFGIVDSLKLNKQVRELIKILDLNLDLDSLIYELPVAQQQMVAIVRALSIDPDILILDEPTASLSEHEVEHLFEMIRKLEDKGVSIIFISHRLEEVFQIADYITVLKDGEVVNNKSVHEVNQIQLIKMMIGREFVNIFPKKSLDIKEEAIFSIRGLTRRGVLREDYYLSKKRVERLMKETEIHAIAKKKYRATTDSKHSLPVAANSLNRNFSVNKLNQFWVADITYIYTQEGWLYLSTIMDLYSCKIVGWSMKNRITQELVLEALHMAIKQRKPSWGLLLHSDRGSQYASECYQVLLGKKGILCSMSRKGNCWDNAVMESFYRTLKVELIYQKKYETKIEAQRDIFEYIEIFYNRERLHSSIGYNSPKEYEKMTMVA